MFQVIYIDEFLIIFSWELFLIPLELKQDNSIRSTLVRNCETF